MFKGISRIISILVVVMVFMSLSVVPAFAFDARGGNSVTIGSGETVNGDLYLAGNDIVINGTVNGDVYAAGKSIIIKGTINGAVTLAGQYVTVDGKIERSARIFGQQIIFNSTIKGDVVTFGSDILIGGSARIGTDLVIGGTVCNILGNVDGNVRGGAGTCTIGGKVGKDVDIEVGELTVDSSAQIQGNLTYTSDAAAKIKSTAKISGKQTQNAPVVKDHEKTGFLAEIPGKIFGFLMAFITGLILIFVATRRINATTMVITSQPWLCLGWGAVFLFAAPIAIIIVCLTLIGLPVGLIALALWLIALYLSQIPVALCIGKLILRRNQPLETKGKTLGALAIGLAILVVLTWLPFIGFFAGLATALFGMGSFFVSEMNLRKGI